MQTAFPIDRYAARGRGVRISSEGRDNSLWQYLHQLDPSIVRVFHMDYSQDAHAKLVKCKALSGLLCDYPLTLNINKCILVSREAAMWAFTTNYPHALLGRTSLSLAQGINSPQTTQITY